jgi:hypothetical protein
MSPFFAPLYLEEFLKFEYTTFTTEVTLCQGFISAVVEKKKKTKVTLLPSWKIGCGRTGISAIRNIEK